VPELAADLRPSLSVARNAIQPALFLDDAAEFEAAAGMRRGVRFKKRIPSQTFA
jgi:hypothetical protein